MDKTFIITGNERKLILIEPVKRLISWLSTKKVAVNIDLNLKEILGETEHGKYVHFEDSLIPSDIILSFGGDGTILHTAKRVGAKSNPILGFNLGGLGFLADVNIDELMQAMEYILHDEFTIESRSVINIETDGMKPWNAYNDIVFDKAGFKRVIEIQVYIENTFIHGYIADGIIISTPTGSTAYNLSAGGPIIVPQSEVKVITPICPHSLTARPLIVPMSSKLRIQVNTEAEGFVCNVDGQEFGNFRSGTNFVSKQADVKLNLIKLNEKDLYTTMRNKLHWGEDFRNKNRWSFNV